jgi:transcriptional regulatory protein GAL4
MKDSSERSSWVRHRSFLHESSVLSFWTGALPKPKDGSWPVLMNMVLAIGAFTGELSSKNADFHFYRIASQSLSMDILQRGSLSLVQAIALMANYLQKRNRPNSGFTFLGVALHMAQGIGLHREFSETAISPFTMEIRRRVWWTLFIFDSGARLTFGRPTMILGGINIQLPRNLEDTDLAVDLELLPQSRDMPTVTSSLIWQSKLAKISNLANKTLLETRLPDRSAILELDNKIISWRENLPSYMQADFSDPNFDMFVVPRMVLLWRSMHLRVVIHRPFILDVVGSRQPLELSDANEPQSRCVHAAQDCILSIINFWNTNKSHPGALVWYACYWLVTAVFVLVTCLLYDPYHASVQSWRKQIESSKVALEEMGAAEPTALRAARMIDKIMGMIVPFSKNKRTPLKDLSFTDCSICRSRP